MTRLLNCKILFINFLIACSSCAFSYPTSELIRLWKQKNGYLLLSIPIKLDTLDPILSINAHSKFTLPLIFESLITINAQQELQPVLAQSWSISSDGKSITISLKHNHHFSDNTEVTAQDVVSSIYRLCSKVSQEFEVLKGLEGCEAHAQGLKVMPQVNAINKYTIKFRINSSPSTFLYQLSSPSAVIAKKSKASLIGSGPYRIQEKKENYITLSKNPFYSGDINIKNSGVIMFYISDHDVVRMISQIKPDGTLMYRMKPLFNFNDNNYKLIKTNPNITEILVLNNQRFPFNKLAVRKALSAEIYNNFIYSCIIGARKPYGIIPNGIGGSLTNMQPDSLPRIMSKELFEQVPELKNKTASVTIHQLDDIKNDCESEQIIKAAKKYHINIKFQYHKDYSDLLPRYLNHNLDGFIDLYIFKNREAYNIFEFFSKKGENDANINQDNIDKMLQEAIATSSSHGRFQIYRKMAQYIQDENMIIPLFYMDHGNLMNKCLSGISEDFFFNPFLELPKIAKMKLCKNV